jgi:hypothetical protein
LTERNGAARTKKAPTDMKSPRKKAARKEGMRKRATREKGTRKTARPKNEVAVADGAMSTGALVTDVTDVTPPEACQPIPSAADLFQEVRELVACYIDLGGDEATAVALWVMMTHAVDAFHTVGYLSITSPEKRSGKSTLFEVLLPLVARGYMTNRETVVALAQLLNDEHVTLLLDEGELSFDNSTRALGLQKIFNGGYRRKGVFGSGEHKLEIFGPKALAINGEPPDTIADRSIPIRILRKLKSTKVQRMRYDELEVTAGVLHARLERWGADFAARSLAKEERAEPAGLDDFDSHRSADICEPLLLIAEECGPEIAESARKSLVTLCNREEDETPHIRALADIKAVFDAYAPSPTFFDSPTVNQKERIRSADLLAGMRKIEGAPWGRNFDAAALARLLRKFGPSLKPKTIRFGPEAWNTAKGYERSQFERYWDSYLPDTDENP